MTRDRRRLLLAVVAAAVIVGGSWLLRDLVETADQTAAFPPPPTAPPAGFRWVGSGHVVVGIPDTWEVDESGCESGLCSGGASGERRSMVSIAFTARDEVSPRDQAVSIDGTAALRSPVRCDGTGCTGRILVPTEQAVVVVRAATSEETERLLDGVRVLEDLVAVPETRFSAEPRPTDSARFAEWAESLGLAVQQRPVEGRVPGQVVSVDPPTGTMVEPGTTVVAEVARPVPPGPDCTDLSLFVVTKAGRQQVYPPDHTVRLWLRVGDAFRSVAEGPCSDLVTSDHDPGSVTSRPANLVVTWLVPECRTLVPAVAATCAAGQARLGSVVVEVARR